MIKYKCTFTGREKKAIGIFYKITDYVIAKDKEEVLLKLYDKYEHISSFYCEEVEE